MIEPAEPTLSPPPEDAGAPRPAVVEETCLLAERPELVEMVTGWMLDEWGADWPGKTPEQVRDDVAAYARADGLPLAVLVFRGDACVGTAAVRAETPGFPEMAPWLVRVYVPPHARGTGAGRAAVRAAEDAARALGHREMYLICLPDREPFYAALGWRTVQTAVYHGHDTLVMRTALG